MNSLHTTPLRLFALSGLLACSAAGADFFPLETGNSWTYKEAKTGQTFTVRVGTPVMVNERVYYSLSGYVDARPLVRQDQGNLVYLDEDKGIELPLTSFEPFEGGWWDSPLRICADGGQTLVKRATHEGPAGTFRDVQEIRYRTFSCADAGVQTEQYAENIGMVRRVSTSFAGPRTYDLVSARIGKARIDSALSGQFRISVEPGTSQLNITLSAETASAGLLKLQFASGQEYEVVLRDSSGLVVWRWSAAGIFIQSLHDLWISGSWTATVSAPRPAAGEYTVQGWLTTIGETPLFAATVPLTLQ